MPADLPINEKQTSTAFDEMMAQDTDAPLRGFPGSELRGPGATGIAASGGRATLPAAALKRFLEDNDGRVLVDNGGARHVLVLGPDRDELWLLDGSGGTRAIADTGHLVPAAGGAEIALHYERLPLRPRFRVGDALPLLPTGERYAAMRLTDWLAARERSGHAALHGPRGFRLPLPGGRHPYSGSWETATAVAGRPVRGAGRAAN